MDNLAPPLQALMYIKLQLGAGVSTRESIKRYIKEYSSSSFAQSLNLWLFERESSQEISYKGLNTPQRQDFVNFLEKGLNGEQIMQSLQELEADMIEISQEDIKRQVERLPFIMLIPLLFLQVPAFLILGIGPIISHFLISLS